MGENTPKWGFGMAPISVKMRERYNFAVQSVLAFFEKDISDQRPDIDGVSDWVFILSTRKQPDLLKVGQTTESVFQAVEEINNATDSLDLLSPRAVFRVPNALQAEKDIFDLLQEHRIQTDGFFRINFSAAVSQIEKHLLINQWC